MRGILEGQNVVQFGTGPVVRDLPVLLDREHGRKVRERMQEYPPLPKQPFGYISLLHERVLWTLMIPIESSVKRMDDSNG